MFETVLLYTGTISGILFLLMTGISLFGGDFDGDVDVDGEFDSTGDETSANFPIFSFKNTLAFLTTFPLTTYYLLDKGAGEPLSIAVGVTVGVLFVLILSTLFYLMSKLAQVNMSSLADIIGETGSVSTTIPPGRTGQISILVNGAFQHIAARSRTGKEISYGQQVQIVDVMDSTTAIVDVI